jgi:putative ABC transport system substrate-binding protein
MNRRNAIVSLLALTASARSGAQPPNRMARIGYLGPSAETAPHLLRAFQEGLAERGYVDGRNVVIDYRWTNAGTRMTDAAELLANARDLVERHVDVLAASIDPAIVAAGKATRTVPIVMLNASDPIELGLVSSLAHPGGNITGLTRISPELVAKHLQLLLEVVPAATRLGLLLGDSTSMNRLNVANAREAAQKRAIALQIVELRAPQDLDTAFVALKEGRAQGLLVSYVGGGWFFTQRERLAQLALTQRLPAIFANTENVEAGGLMSYSPDSIANYRRAAAFIDRILRGTKPGDIPIEQPTQFELAINMKTAKAMNIAIPQSVLLRADRVIQ